MLTAIAVKNAKAKDKPYKLTDGKGLYLHISPSGKKTWRYRYELAGKESTCVLGEYPALSLEDARLKRAEARELVKQGISPTQEKRKQKNDALALQREEKKKQANSFEAVAREWHDSQKERWSPGHASAVLNRMKKDVFPRLGNIPIDQITPPEVHQVLQAIEARGAGEVARKCLDAMNGVFRYAVRTGKATVNPAADMRETLKARKVKHHTVVKPEEVPALLKAIVKSDLHVSTKLAIQFVMLTAARSGEVRMATWEEIDFEKSLWLIPAERMKVRQAHVVPLSTQASAILKRAQILFGGKGLIFPGIRHPERPLSENTMLFGLYRVGYHSKMTMHGFRALFSSIANEKGKYNPDAIEKQLAHGEKDAIRAAYHRAEYMEERTELMQWWADYLDEELNKAVE